MFETSKAILYYLRLYECLKRYVSCELLSADIFVIFILYEARYVKGEVYIAIAKPFQPSHFHFHRKGLNLRYCA